MIEAPTETRRTQARSEPELVAPLRRPRLIDRISGWEGLAIVAFWLISTTWLSTVAPAPDPVQPPLIVALNVIANIGFFGALAGAITARRVAFFGSAVTGGAIAIMATFCGLEGHTGLWIPAQFSIGAAALGYGVYRLRT